VHPAPSNRIKPLLADEGDACESGHTKAGLHCNWYVIIDTCTRLIVPVFPSFDESMHSALGVSGEECCYQYLALKASGPCRDLAAYRMISWLLMVA
jgi:hypothetical protein